MPITLTIIEDGHILHVKFRPPWKAQDMLPLFEQERRYRDEVLHSRPGQKVQLLAEFVNPGVFPPGTLRAPRA